MDIKNDASLMRRCQKLFIAIGLIIPSLKSNEYYFLHLYNVNEIHNEATVTRLRSMTQIADNLASKEIA